MKLKFKSKFFYYFLFIIFIFISIFFSFSNISTFAHPKLISKIVSAFEKIENYIVAISTPAAAVSIGCRILNAKV